MKDNLVYAEKLDSFGQEKSDLLFYSCDGIDAESVLWKRI